MIDATSFAKPLVDMRRTTRVTDGTSMMRRQFGGAIFAACRASWWRDKRHKPGGVFTAQTKYFFVRSITVSPHVTAAEDCDDLILFAVLDERPYQHGVNTVEMSMKIQIHNDSLSK